MQWAPAIPLKDNLEIKISQVGFLHHGASGLSHQSSEIEAQVRLVCEKKNNSEKVAGSEFTLSDRLWKLLESSVVVLKEESQRLRAVRDPKGYILNLDKVSRTDNKDG